MESLSSCLNNANHCYPLIKLLADSSENLIAVFENNHLVLLNQPFLNFSRVDSCEFFLREYGSLTNRFVPHDDYFHLGQVDDPDHWLEAIENLDEEKKIISMFNYKIEPHAFSFSVYKPLESVTVLIFTDITQKLIERIMSENDGNIDGRSGAFTKEYFIHTFKNFQNAAIFNKKNIALTMIRTSADNDHRTVANEIKQSTRKNDMLIQWDDSRFVIAFLVDNAENAQLFSSKISRLSFRPGGVKTALMKTGESLEDMIFQLNSQ